MGRFDEAILARQEIARLSGRPDETDMLGDPRFISLLQRVGL